MLPHFLWQDFADIVGETQRLGFDIALEWFAPHYEFRFPKIGELGARGVQLVLRHALEPWHVMGEEGAAGTTVRYVDSSLERLEVHATGLIDPRHVVTVNGQPLSLQPTGRVGEFVGGVRYRAWRPASALHPTIGVHAPLTIDLVDRWQQRSLGGGQYHVAHPGGRSYDTFPVNAYEAESRRLARFFPINHTPGRTTLPPTLRGLEFPFSLDLRHV